MMNLFGLTLGSSGEGVVEIQLRIPKFEVSYYSHWYTRSSLALREAMKMEADRI